MAHLKTPHRVLHTLLLVTVLAAGAAVPVAAQGWTPVAPGVDYQQFRGAGPSRVFVVRMDRSQPNLTLETAIAQRQLEDGKATVSEMVGVYDQSLTAWEPAWGARMDVIAAINGSFHDIETGVPQSGMVSGGWYIRRFDDLGGGSGFAWRLDRSAMIGSCVRHPPDGQLLTVIETNASHRLAKINGRPAGNELAVFTHHYGRRMPAAGNLSVMVQMDQPLTILEYPEMATGTVVEVAAGSEGRTIPFDQAIVTGRGSAASWLRDNVEVGDRVGFSMRIDHYQSDCQAWRGVTWAETYASLSGSFEFLMDGEIRSFDDLGATVRNPRTAICFNDDYLYFVVVDGRNPGVSEGMTIEELGAFCRDDLGANWGINQDGGGSSALWVDGDIVNNPSDGHERPVANALMLVAVEPIERSTRFSPGAQIETTGPVDLSVGPGQNFQTPQDVGAGEVGTVLADPHGLDGVLATGSYWWKIGFQGRVGWVAEQDLELIGGESAAGAKPPQAELDDVKNLLASQLWLQARAVHLRQILLGGW